MANHLSQSYVARELGVSRQAVNQLIKRGKIPCVEGTNKIPREWMESEDGQKRKHTLKALPVEANRGADADLEEAPFKIDMGPWDGN